MTIYGKKLVREALQYYPFREADICFLRHNENITCKVTEQGKAYVLRIQAPVPGFTPGLYEETPLAERMQGEVELLLHLSQTAPFPVQTPMKNQQGDYITILSGGIPCELLQWVEGEPLSRIADRSGGKKEIERYAAELGVLAAKLHDAARGFTGTRPVYSHELVGKMVAELGTAYKKAHISSEHHFICRAVLEEVDHVMNLLDPYPDAQSLIHADLSFGNVLVTPSGLAPIDFSLSGFGYRAMECGMLAADYEDKKVQECICESYERETGIAIDRHHRDVFLAFSVLLFITAQHNRFWRERWFQDAMNRWTQGIFVL